MDSLDSFLQARYQYRDAIEAATFSSSLTMHGYQDNYLTLINASDGIMQELLILEDGLSTSVQNDQQYYLRNYFSYDHEGKLVIDPDKQPRF